ncbi:MAG: tRNA (guanosine(37)-N1)-methyltransferase TrmD [Candidatus Gastranaerophilales bacterium]|nr:tRNA (guanosine(37)-N1)-methyltransferase TrmD [Candidatus Gastranaerophilales bacterium]
MNFNVLTLFPELIKQSCNHSIIKRAKENNFIQINTINPRDFTLDKHKKVDDSPYGGGAGMVLACQPFLDALKSIEKIDNAETIILTPQGEKYTQQIAWEFAKKDQLNIICGHYEGFDERIRTLSKAREISLGDFVLTGGEYPALCIIDSVSRLIKGTLGDDDSAKFDSHSEGLLEYPQYTKPRSYENLDVPEVILNGNHAEINKWRRLQQFIRTKQKRPDMWINFLKQNLSKIDIKILKEYKDILE